MLTANVEYTIGDVGRVLQFTVEQSCAGVTATLHSSAISATKTWTNYSAWSESGFAMIARGIAEFSDELSEERGLFTGVSISITSTAARSAVDKPYCLVNLAGTRYGNKLSATGPVLRMTVPLVGQALPDSLIGVLQLMLLTCEPTIGGRVETAKPPPAYSSETADERFIFIEDLPDLVQPWFVAHLKQFSPSALQRQEHVATLSAYQQFCGACP